MVKRAPVIAGRKHPHHSTMDLSKGSLPVIIVCTLIAMVAIGAYNIGSLIADMRADKITADTKFASIDTELKTIRTLLQGSNYLSSGEFEQWCRLTESLNKGWKCPPPMQPVPRYGELTPR